MYNADGTDLSERAGKLVRSVEQLTASVNELKISSVVARARSRHNRMLIGLTVLGLVLDLLLSLALAHAYEAGRDNSRRIECQANQRAKLLKLNDSDRKNMTSLIVALSDGTITTKGQYAVRFAQFKKLADANDAGRRRLAAGHPCS